MLYLLFFFLSHPIKGDKSVANLLFLYRVYKGKTINNIRSMVKVLLGSF
jgi:hypothetical protein